MLGFIGVLILLCPELRAMEDSWMYWWIGGYAGYLLILEMPRRYRRTFYDSSLFRLLRIQIEIVLTSVLLLRTGGSESPFWFIYLLPLFTSIFYFHRTISWIVYAEIAGLFYSVSILEAGALSGLKLSLYLTDLSVLLILTVVLHYTAEIMKRHQQTEQQTVRLQMLQRLNEVGQTLTALQESPEILQTTLKRIADVALQFLEAEVIELYRYRTESNEFDFPPIRAGEHRLSEFDPLRSSPDDTIVRVAHTGKKLYISDTGRSSRSTEDSCSDRSEERSVREEHIRSAAVIPMKVGSEVIGVMFVGYQWGCNFETKLETRERIETLASYAAIAVQNARLLQQELTLRKQAENLQSTLHAISPAFDLQEVAERILDELRKVIEYHKASLHLIQKDTRTLLAGRGFDINFKDPIFHRPLSEDPLIRSIVEREEPLILSDTSKAPDWKSSPGTTDVKSWIGVPLIHEQETIGLVTLDHVQSGFYTQENETILIPFARQAAINLRKAYLFGSAKQRIEHLEIVNNVGQIMGSKLDTQDLLNTVVSELANHLHCARCILFFPQKVNNELLLVPKIGYGVDVEQIRAFKPHEGLAGWGFKQSKSLVLNNTGDDPRYLPSKEGYNQSRSMLVAPVTVGARTIGVICASHDEADWFNEGEQRFADTLAQQAGIAIERAIALELLQDIGNQIIRAQKIDEILRRIVSGAIRLTNTSTGVIYLISENGQTVIETVHSGDFRHPEPRMQKKDGLTRKVIETGEILTIFDISNDTRVHSDLRKRYQSMIVVPLKLERTVIGVLYLDDENFHDFTETEKTLLSTLADQAVIAIKNAKLLEERQQRLEEFEDLYDNLEKLSYAATSLIGASTHDELSSKALRIVFHRLNADVSLYVCQEKNPEIMQLTDCIPENFTSRLKTVCLPGESPLKPELSSENSPGLLMEAHSRDGRCEGLIFVQRVGTLTRPAENFSKVDEQTLFLLATAIGHTLQNLRKTNGLKIYL